MSRNVAGLVALAALSALIPAVPATADDTGVAQALHTIRREGGRLCLDGHFHNGTSAGQASKKAALAAAIDNWQGFTAWEYGTDWARFRKAASKSMKCSISGSSWGCSVDARPCR